MYAYFSVGVLHVTPQPCLLAFSIGTDMEAHCSYLPFKKDFAIQLQGEKVADSLGHNTFGLYLSF